MWRPRDFFSLILLNASLSVTGRNMPTKKPNAAYNLNLTLQEECVNGGRCTHIPENYPTDFVNELFTSQMLPYNLGVASLRDEHEQGGDHSYDNDIRPNYEYETIFALVSPDKKLKYLIPQSHLYNQTIRTVTCPEPIQLTENEHIRCNRRSFFPNNEYESFPVQIYGKIILTALTVHNGNTLLKDDDVKKVSIFYKSGCVCKYRKLQ